jgi:serine/threonine protein kinase
MSGIHTQWRDLPALWKTFPLIILPQCSVRGEVLDPSGHFICSYTPLKHLGEGAFSVIDKFRRRDEKGKLNEIALKRPKYKELNLLYEALFQWKLHHDLEEYGLSHTVPQVYDIFLHKPTGAVWFTMEAFEPLTVSDWCLKRLGSPEYKHYFILLMLQIALVLEVFDTGLRIDHKDLKINNMIVVETPVSVKVTWNREERVLEFPFRVVFIDFGFACKEYTIDLKTDDLPPLDPCPKEGRNVFQVLVSLWNIQTLRELLDASWGHWVRERISAIVPEAPALRLTESDKSLDWMYTLTDHTNFRAPLCAPRRIIADCMRALERG